MLFSRMCFLPFALSQFCDFAALFKWGHGGNGWRGVVYFIRDRKRASAFGDKSIEGFLCVSGKLQAGDLRDVDLSSADEFAEELAINLEIFRRLSC